MKNKKDAVSIRARLICILIVLYENRNLLNECLGFYPFYNNNHIKAINRQY